MPEFDRRGLLRGGLTLGAALALWGCARDGRTGDADEVQQRLLTVVADLVIPRTNTPSASQVGVPAFVALALAHGLDGAEEAAGGAAIQGAETTPDRSGGGLYLLTILKCQLDAAVPIGDFLSAPARQQHDALVNIDAAAFAPDAKPGAWHIVKDLILIGYYTSEAGGSKELRYELVPGRFDPDIPITDDRAFSSDWTARDFG